MILFGSNNHVYGVNNMMYFGYQNAHELTLQTDGNGTLMADVLTGNTSDTATLTPSPNLYYDFSGYTLTGDGTINGNTFTFGSENTTAKAWFSAIHYNITTANDGHGTCTCNKTTATGGETATLGNSPATHYQFNNYQITGGSVNGNTLTVTANCTAKATFKAKSYSITLQTDGHGKLTCNASTATGGQTVTLTPTYSSYYRFNNYSITGGSVNGNTLTVTANCTAKANFKVNAFTASGGFEKGSNVQAVATKDNVSKAVGAKYATVSYHTSNVPTAWYSTSNRWHPSNANSYKITLYPKVTTKYAVDSITNMGAKAQYVTYVNGAATNSQSYSVGTKVTGSWSYSKTITSNAQSYYYISGYIQSLGHGKTGYTRYSAVTTYTAASTTGTWVATGYVP